MDVFGRGPTNEAGEYFRANVWAWRPIHDLIHELCSDLLGDELILDMAINNGEGPDTQEICDEMASRFEEWMEHNIQGHALNDDLLQQSPEGKVIEALGLTPGTDESPRYQVSDEYLKEWIEFLRHCGGFEVW